MSDLRMQSVYDLHDQAKPDDRHKPDEMPRLKPDT